mgnify:CR=1 FL=1
MQTTSTMTANCSTAGRAAAAAGLTATLLPDTNALTFSINSCVSNGLVIAALAPQALTWASSMPVWLDTKSNTGMLAVSGSARIARATS